ncbi:Lipase class 3 [Penicillium longicatenatum]|uniref:Lipase class 3 n=1 Tax=Penicillium longicatenatum TaxID=1561947 RepID=UPI00254687F4|nr:Lipase class 3 [Penicillium longicatenatum]KAJ5649215.1 Lipase class 3 [Penicillium longicatenatum]
MAAALVVAMPAKLFTNRDVDTTTYDNLYLFAQYSAAAYCSNNVDTTSTGDSITCSADNCPQVQSATTKTLYEFDESNDYGDTAGFLVVDETNDLIVLSFRGSTDISNWVANLDFVFNDDSGLCTGCDVHSGFWKAWETVADDVTAKIDSAQSTYPGYQLVVTGHSLGGALAALAGTALRNAGYTLDLYTYGQPRVGNDALAEYMTSQGSLWRTTHTDDIVPRIPPELFGYAHASPEYWITSADDVTVTDADIEEVVGVNSNDGNAGESDESISAHKCGPQSPRRRNRIKAILITIGIVLALYFLFFAGPESPTKAVNNDRPSYAQRPTPKPKIDPIDEQARPAIRKRKDMIVASMKNDDTTWLAEYFPDWSRSIYVVDDKKAPLTVAKNKGRESMVYLTYIIDNYENLPDIMLFIHSLRYQWHNDDPYYDGVPMLRNFQVPYLQKMGYVNLRCVWTLGCPVEIHPSTDTHRDDVHAGEYFKTGFMELFPDEPIPKEVGVSCCAQFGVTRDTVLTRPKSDYERFRVWLSNTSLGDDLSGRIMEYSWHMIFGQPPVHCPAAGDCYCNVFGLCNLNCPNDAVCDNRYVLPPFSSLPKGWPFLGWKGQEQDPTYGLPET